MVMREWRRGAQVRRYHTERVIGHQTVAEHSWGVAMLLWHLYPDLCDVALLVHALQHDLPEGRVGDVPAPAKWGSEALSRALDTAEEAEWGRLQLHGYELSSVQARAFALCDLLEAALFAAEQVELGNRNMVEVIARCLPRLRALGCPPDFLPPLEALCT